MKRARVAVVARAPQRRGAASGPEAARRLRAAIRAIVRRFALSERADVACCGLTVAQAATLEAMRADPRLRLGDLGRRLGITPSTLSRNLARLEADGLVTRVVDPGDARAAHVALTASGQRAAGRVERQEEAFAVDVLSRLPKGQSTRVLASLQTLLEAVREATEECCPGAFDHLMEGGAGEGSRAGRKERGREGCC
jgi:DNA-binding MarR family transcriptional regulator